MMIRLKKRYAKAKFMRKALSLVNFGIKYNIESSIFAVSNDDDDIMKVSTNNENEKLKKLIEDAK